MTNSQRGRRFFKRVWLIAALAVLVAGVFLGVALTRDGDSGTPAGAASGTKADATGASSSATPSGGAATPVGERSDADNYRADVVACNSKIAQQLDGLTRQLVNVQYSDASWVNETKSILAQMAATADEARAIRPTPEYQEAHAVWLEGIESYEWVADNLATAITARDDKLLIQCSERLGTASAKFQEATGLMQRVAVD